MQTYLVYMTAGSRDEALTIGRTLVAERLAACTNVFPEVTSIYRWQNKIQEDAECVFFAKTTAECLDELIARVKSLHSYDCPCIVALPLSTGYEEFLQWVADETQP